MITEEELEEFRNKGIKQTSYLIFGALPAARAFRSYCTGFSHGPVSAAIANAFLLIH